MKWEKSYFDSNFGISCQEATRAQMKPNSFGHFGHQLHASVHSLCVAREFWETDIWSHFHRDECPELSICHCLGYGRLQDRVDCPVDHVRVFKGVEVQFFGNLEPPYLSTAVCSSDLITRCRPSSRMCGLWSVIMDRSWFSGWAKFTLRRMTGSMIFLCLGLRNRDLTSIWWMCL